jgi:pyruvate dehydrogenase E2 component (dihydrolipoamide acetyltransferase)
MSFEFKIPELGENIETGTVAKIIVSVGDQVKKDQSLIELETDKAVIEVPANKAGKISKILVSEGEEVKVGQSILVIDEGDGEKPREKSEEDSGKKAKKAEPEEKEEKTEEVKPPKETKKPEKGKQTTSAAVSGAKKTINFVIPDLGENIESGTIAKILVSTGDNIKKEQGLLELETDKAVVEVPSEIGGKVKEIFVKEGDTARVGQKILSIETTDSGEAAKPEEAQISEKEEIEPTTEQPEEKEKESPERKEPAREEEISEKPGMEKKYQPELPSPMKRAVAPAAPSVRRFAREIGIDINEVSGTGPGGRISIEDVKSFAKMLNKQKAVSDNVLRGIEAEKLPDFSKWGEIEVKPMSKVREKTAKHLAYAWATIPHVTQFDKADITDLEKLRKEFGKKVESAGGKLTVTGILLKVISSAFKVFPQFNASVDLVNSQVIYKKYHNIGIAVDTDRGLLVPVIRNVDRKNLIDLSVELTAIAEKARNAKLTLEDMQGGNFSISNLGGIGGSGFTPVVNSPEVAVLGVSRSQMEPVFTDGNFIPRLMLPLSLSYDHRLIDGADAARFLRWVCEALEKPFKVLVEG